MYALRTTILILALAATAGGQLQPPAGATRPKGYVGMTVGEDADGRLFVVEVAEDSPAARGGLRAGDKLLFVDEREIRDAASLLAALAQLRPGDKATLVVARDGRRLQLAIEVGAGPRLTTDDAPLLGLTTAPVAKSAPGEPAAADGAVVVGVIENTPADKAGVPLDAVIVKANGRAVRSPEDLRRLVRKAGPGGHLELIYFHRGRLVKTSLTLAAHGHTRQLVAPPSAESQRPAPAAERRAPSAATEKPSPAVPALRSDRQRIRLLEQRIEELERRIAELEKQQAPM